MHNLNYYERFVIHFFDFKDTNRILTGKAKEVIA